MDELTYTADHVTLNARFMEFPHIPICAWSNLHIRATFQLQCYWAVETTTTPLQLWFVLYWPFPCSLHSARELVQTARPVLIAIMSKSVQRKGMHVLTTGRAQAILSRAITLPLQIRERTQVAHTVHRPIGLSQLAPAISVLRIQDSIQNVNLRITLTTLLSQPAPLHMGMSVNTTVGCYKVDGSNQRTYRSMGSLPPRA